MRLVTRTASDHVPGAGQTAAREVREWVCPECDYFEETEDDEEA
jgi:hypothetical protein